MPRLCLSKKTNRETLPPGLPGGHAMLRLGSGFPICFLLYKFIHGFWIYEPFLLRYNGTGKQR